MRIGIAGAGIGGLAVATLLARDGHKVVVFDQFETPQPVGSGLMLQETGLTILGRLNLRDEMERLGAPINRLYGLSAPSGRAVLDVRYSALRSSLKGLGVQRGALFNLLYRTARDAGVEIEAGTEIITAQAMIGSLVDSGGKTHGPFDLIVDALGVRSPLADSAHNDLPYGALWATLPWPVGDVFNGGALEQRYRAARQMTGVMPSGRANTSAPEMATYFWSLKVSDEAAWRDAPLQHWKDEAIALWPETAGLLTHIHRHEDLTFARYRHRTYWPCVEGRLVHLGDSWHAASPQLGQGANNALLDAYALAEGLRRAGNDVAEALSLYAKMRAGHVRLFQMMSFLFTPVYQSDSHILPWFRDWLAAPASRIWPGPQILAGMVSGAVGWPLAKLGLKRGA